MLLADPRMKRIGSLVENLDRASGEMRVALREVAVMVPRMTALVEKIDQMVGEANGEGLAASGARLQELGREMTIMSRQLTHTLQMLEDAPQSMHFGPPAAPGPGEPGFVAPAGRVTGRTTMKKLIVIPLVLLAACASQGKGTADIAIYDLAGANAPSAAVAAAHAGLALELRLPVWLDSTAIVYRLAYADPQRVHRYARGPLGRAAFAAVAAAAAAVVGDSAGESTMHTACRTR